MIENITHDRICRLRVQDARGRILVFLSVYMPAVGARDDLAGVLDDLSNIIDNLDDDVIPIICGDLNGDMGRAGGPRGLGEPTRAGRLIVDFKVKYDLVAANLLNLGSGPVHTFESHNGSSCIDYILTPRFMEDMILSCKVRGEEPLNTSDHFPIMMRFLLDKLPCKIDSSYNRRRIRWDKWDEERLVLEYQAPLSVSLGTLRDKIRAQICTPDLLDSYFKELIRMLHSAAEVLPRTKFVAHLKPYWDDELTFLKKEKMKYLKIWKESGRPRDVEDPARINMSLSKNRFRKD